MKVETWHEALDIPGKLRIDIGNPSDGNGFLFGRWNTPPVSEREGKWEAVLW
jgi:hypothetical protein